MCDPHELANALGPQGVHWFVDSCAGLPIDVLASVPACVPASPFESPRAPLTLADRRPSSRATASSGWPR